jgi:hypothetical protein
MERVEVQIHQPTGGGCDPDGPWEIATGTAFWTLPWTPPSRR